MKCSDRHVTSLDLTYALINEPQKNHASETLSSGVVSVDLIMNLKLLFLEG